MLCGFSTHLVQVCGSTICSPRFAQEIMRAHLPGPCGGSRECRKDLAVQYFGGSPPHRAHRSHKNTSVPITWLEPKDLEIGEVSLIKIEANASHCIVP